LELLLSPSARARDWEEEGGGREEGGGGREEGGGRRSREAISPWYFS